MRNTIFITMLAGLIAGCTTERMQLLNQYQAEYAPWASGESITSVTFTRTGGSGSLPQCIAEIVSNQGETISDSSGSFFGAYTGNYYSRNNSQQVTGGNVLEHTSTDGKTVVSSGSTRYQASALVARSVRFKLTAKKTDNGVDYRFSSLQQAQLNSGAAANTGYNPIGSWSGANPDLAMKSLSDLTDQINECMSR